MMQACTSDLPNKVTCPSWTTMGTFPDGCCTKVKQQNENGYCE